jgi:hypothetical protein
MKPRPVRIPFILVSLVLASWVLSVSAADKKTAKLTLHTVKASDKGEGDKYDTESEKLKSALKSINKSYFRYVKKYEYTVTLGEKQSIEVPVGKVEITVKEKDSGKYPVTVRWIKDSDKDYVKINLKISPGSLLAVGSDSASYDGGKLVLVVKVDDT